MPSLGMSKLAPALSWPKYFYQGFNRQYFRKVLTLDRQNLIGYWPMWEASGSVADDLSGEGNDGAYTDVTLAEVGIGDGRSCPLFDGSASFSDIHSAGLVADFGKLEGTFAIWAKVSAAAVWEDGDGRRAVNIRVDGNNYLDIGKASANDRLAWNYKAGGTLENRVKSSISPTDWIHLALTWSDSADEVKAYYNGVQEGATMTGVGTWVGDPASTLSVIGALNTTPTTVWDGWLAHPAIWKAPLASEKILSLATV